MHDRQLAEAAPSHRCPARGRPGSSSPRRRRRRPGWRWSRSSPAAVLVGVEQPELVGSAAASATASASSTAPSRRRRSGVETAQRHALARRRRRSRRARSVVGREGVDRDDGRDAEAADVRDLLRQVGRAGAERRPGSRRAGRRGGAGRPRCGTAGVGLQRAHGRDDDRGVRGARPRAALDVEEPLGTHVGAEAGLGDHEVAARRAIRSAMHRRRCRWRCCRTGRSGRGPGVSSRVCSRLGLMASFRITAIAPAASRSSAVTGSPVVGVADHDPAQALAQVAQRRRERQDRHHLAGRGDVEPGLARHAVHARRPGR